MNIQKLYNPFMIALLRSPLHGLLGSGMAVLTLRGRKTGRPIAVPISVLRQGDGLVAVSFKHRTWWRNLRGGSPVILRWQGVDHPASAEVTEDQRQVALILLARVRAIPAFAGMYGVSFRPDGLPDPAQIAQAAAGRVVITICP